MPQQRLSSEPLPSQTRPFAPPSLVNEADAVTNAALASQTSALPHKTLPRMVSRFFNPRQVPVILIGFGVHFGLIWCPLVALASFAFGETLLDACLAAFGAIATSVAAFAAWTGETARRAVSNRHRGGRGRGLARRLVVQTALLIAVQGALWSALTTNWPLRVTFAVSRPAIERFAARVERGEKFTFPMRVGALRVYGVSNVDELSDGVYWYNIEPRRNTYLLHDSQNATPDNTGDLNSPFAPGWTLFNRP